ncbi:DNA-binding MurR/RpiR family transcriptional regulator [Streptosporangium becharense]|uniref:DNA-binding MurR/RpiR family transcriptional regulator n=1 Tax=Streptosporangium becharense TaxID=1816182 RepID=A0A7W9MFQ3_9ACTN|nr:MurR/RpiR family transcriptional regulator [Streptosporangium becharense]MBB2910020.1 DNA-binding MurR/RpiR family transcriptional regulator [Streptosporangium becharense]MBB5819025.1 DNA-binding MurR/RpiR family transcriptional regulator [Streptosporangium becharense]
MGDGLDQLLEGRRLSPVQRRIARYIGDHLSEAVFLSSVELADRAGVSQPSVTRFAMSLGFAGYPELKQALRPLVVGGRGPSGANDLQAAIDVEIENLRAVRESLNDPSDVTDLGTKLAGCEPLPVLGLRVSSGLATTFAYFARRIHPDVRLLTHGGSELADGLHAARRAGAGWLVAVILPRYPAEAVQALRTSRDLGLRTAVITDRRDVPFEADEILAAPVGERLVFDSHAAPLALAMVLVEAMADAAPLRTQARLEEYERMIDQAGVFTDHLD